MERTVGAAGKPRHRRLTAALLCGGLLFALSACAEKKEPPKGRPPVPVSVATVGQRDVPVQIQAIGNVEPFNAVGIKAQVDGQISRVHFTEGQDVTKGDLLFTIDPRPFQTALKHAEAVLARDLAQARYAREQVRRYGSLLKDGIVSQDQYDQLRANADALEGTIAADRAAVEQARLQLNYCSVRAPIAGRTGNLAVRLGNLVKANEDPALVTINQITPVYVAFAIPERNLAEIKGHLANGPLSLTAAVPNDPQGAETGKVTFLDNTVDTATGMIRLKGTFPNAARRLWPGQFVNVVITLTTRPNSMVVPLQSVQTGQQGQFVFVVKPDATAELRPVTAGVTHEGFTVIEKGLQPGETVVTDGQMRLGPGAKVTITQGRP